MRGQKTGGRAKGTPNKITAEQAQKVAEFLQLYQDGEIADADGTRVKFIEDFASLDPAARVGTAVRLQAMITPKPVDVSIQPKADISIEERLAALSAGSQSG